MSSADPNPAHAEFSEVIRAADQLIMEVLDDLEPTLLERSGGNRTSPKSDGTPVTATDFLVDEHLTKAIAVAFPDHDVLSEEASTTWSGNDWTWIVDPIDGTSNFAAGLPYWAVSIALAHRGMPVYGCVAAPALGERFVGHRGGGAHLIARTTGRTRVAVRDAVDYRSGRNKHIPIAVSAGTIRRSHGTKVRLNARIMGAWALDLAFVAAGRLVGSYATIPHVWDVAAGMLLVEEAGGAVAISGAPLLPLREGVDYATASTPTATGPDAAWVHDLLVTIG